MAWNEPGGGNKGDKDPWGNRDDQGPPDLDEVFRKIQRRLGPCSAARGAAVDRSVAAPHPLTAE